MTEREYFRKVLQNYREGAYTDSELEMQVFEHLTPANLPAFLALAGSDVLGVLKESARRAPRTDEEWGRTIRIVGGTYSVPDPESWRRAEEEAKRAFRLGVETLRRHFAIE